jgi:hypothetical protein
MFVLNIPYLFNLENRLNLDNYLERLAPRVTKAPSVPKSPYIGAAQGASAFTFYQPILILNIQLGGERCLLHFYFVNTLDCRNELE